MIEWSEEKWLFRWGKARMPWGPMWFFALWVLHLCFDPYNPNEVSWWNKQGDKAIYLWPLGLALEWVTDA